MRLINEGLTRGVLRVAIEQAIHLNSLGHTNIAVAGFHAHIFQGFSGSKFEPNFPEKFIPDWIICHNLVLIYDEQIEDSKGDLLAEPFNIEDFIEKTRYLLGNPAEARMMGLRGKKWLKEKFPAKSIYEGTGNLR